ncbi:GroES-like protein [Desarmillaria tabescens]|uniref:GroES-like protein n=1 Tax=Armillaria tabescens TaxID=1929756 RepID=A0AA39TQ67_ARMTA|nr:GroES-like protein [Desarmillaria tabescens]KAK0462643.1 GroES-like protein [Desarmillaria tabescens]
MAQHFSNKACVLVGPEMIEFTDVPVPPLGREDVLVRVEASGICGTDITIYKNFGLPQKALTKPLVMGHEAAGVVARVGEAVMNVAVGDRVAIEPFFFCKKCHNCKTGRTNLCKTPRQAGFGDVPGLLSQYYVCDADFVVKFPDSLSWEEAGCIQPLAVAVQLAKRAKFAAGQTIAIFGCGPLGSLVMAVARAYGVSKILAFGRSQERVDFARKSWADYAAVSPPLDEGQDVTDWAEAFKTTTMNEAGVESCGVDIAVEATSAEAYMHAGMAFLRPGGTYVQAGIGQPVNSFPTFTIVAKELDVIGTVRYTAGCFQTAVDLLASGKIDLKPMITAVFPLSKVAEALKYAMKREGLKVILMNQQI